MKNKQTWEYLVACGSNLGDRCANVDTAIKMLEDNKVHIHSIANMYETDPIGNCTEVFINSAVKCLSYMEPEPFLNLLLSIENSMGRIRKIHHDNRIIDLDILLGRNTEDKKMIIVDRKDLSIPHPEMLNRNFVLVPAVDIAGDWIHPLSGKSLADELRERRYSL